MSGGCYFRWAFGWVFCTVHPRLPRGKAFGWLRLLPGGVWRVAWRVCCSFLEASEGLLLGTMEMRMPRALPVIPPEKLASDPQIPRHNFTHFCSAQLCHSEMRLFPVLPLRGTALGNPPLWPMPHSPWPAPYPALHPLHVAPSSLRPVPSYPCPTPLCLHLFPVLVGRACTASTGFLRNRVQAAPTNPCQG